MKRQYSDILLLIAVIISIYGLVTGRFLFLILMIPVGLNLFGKKKGQGN